MMHWHTRAVLTQPCGRVPLSAMTQMEPTGGLDQEQFPENSSGVAAGGPVQLLGVVCICGPRSGLQTRCVRSRCA